MSAPFRVVDEDRSLSPDTGYACAHGEAVADGLLRAVLDPADTPTWTVPTTDRAMIVIMWEGRLLSANAPPSPPLVAEGRAVWAKTLGIAARRQTSSPSPTNRPSAATRRGSSELSSQ
jgi:hypothetical protein